MQQAIYEVAPLALEKSLSITVELIPPGRCLYFEVGQIEQVLINILDNACKFTPRGGAITVSGYPFFWERRRATPAPAPEFDRRSRNDPEPNSYRLDISDAGSPIPNDLLASIFEEYASYGRDRSGGGLGLAICKMILSQHEGRIWAENTNSGPLFAFVLPVSRSEQAVFRRAEAVPNESNPKTVMLNAGERSHAG